MRLEEKRVHGHAVVVLESDILALTIVAGKGADIVSFIHKPTGTEFLWQSPIGMNVLLKPQSETRYIGGWIEVFPNAWSGCTHQGRELAGYGDVWQLPWDYHIIRNDREEIQVEFSVQTQELPLLLKKVVTLKVGASIARIYETVSNTGNEAVDFTWGHHPNIGRPFLNEDCVIDLPQCEIFDADNKVGEWPFLTGESETENLSVIPKYGTSTENRQIFLRNLVDSWAVVRNIKTGLSFKLAWDGTIFTDMLLWRSFNTDWSETFGDNQILCFFPKRSLRNVAEAAKRGEMLTLVAGEVMSSWIEAGITKTIKEW